MKRHLLSLFLVLVTVSVVWGQEQYPAMIAHRGAHTAIIPENSVAAVAAAKRYGYVGIECDVHYTADSVMVILHDATLNRTARYAKDYAPLKEDVHLSRLTFEELRRDYVLASENPALRTPIPTLKELLDECKKQGIVPMLHSNIVDSYRMAQEIFGNEWIAFTSDKQALLKARTFSDCLILWSINGGTAEETLEGLKEIGGKCGISTMNTQLLTADFCRALTSKGHEVQASIFPVPHEATAQRNGITYQLTDYSLMPNSRFTPISRWETADKQLPATQEIGKTWCDKIEYGGITLGIEFKGKILVMVNDHQYTLKRETMGADYVGTRFSNNSALVQIRALEDTEIKSANALLYQF